MFFGDALEEKWFYPCSSLEFTSLNSATKIYKTLKRFIYTVTVSIMTLETLPMQKEKFGT